MVGTFVKLGELKFIFPIQTAYTKMRKGVGYQNRDDLCRLEEIRRHGMNLQ
jgi:hypothetical protein